MMSEPPNAVDGGLGKSNGGARSPVALLNDTQWAYLQKRFRLTARERQVVELVCQGLTNSGIAARLRVRPETVKTHVRNVYRKTGVGSKVLLLLRFIAEATPNPDERC